MAKRKTSEEEDTTESWYMQNSTDPVSARQFCTPSGAHELPADYKNYKPVIEGRFSAKGGSCKTTSSVASAFLRAEQGGRVMVVDCDPQRNAEQAILHRTVGCLHGGDYGSFFSQEGFIPERINLYVCLLACLSGANLRPAQLTEVGLPKGAKGELFLLPGHANLPIIEEQFSRAVLEESMPAIEHYIGAFYHLLLMTACAYKIDYIYVDLSPSLGTLNRLFLLSCDYWTLPMVPDFFCWEALRTLTTIVPPQAENGRSASLLQRYTRHYADVHSHYLCRPRGAMERLLEKTTDWRRLVQELAARTRSCAYPFPERPPKVLGGFIGRFQASYLHKKTAVEGANRRRMVKNHQYWNERIREAMAQFIQRLPPEMKLKYPREVVEHSYILAELENMDQLSAISQRESLPMFMLLRNHLYTYDSENETLVKISSHLEDIERRITRHREDTSTLQARVDELCRLCNK